MSDLLVLGGGTSLYQPDALSNFTSSQSAESSVTCKYRGRRIAPAGPSGEISWIRLLVAGYHTTAISFYVTPLLDGKLVQELRTFVSRPAPSTGVEERFSVIVPLFRVHPEYNIRYSLVGSTADVLVELTDPAARVDFETFTFLHEPIDNARNRGVSE